MTESDPKAVRAIALSEAVKMFGPTGDAEAVVAIAAAFYDFLNGNDKQPAAEAPAKTETKAKTEKKPKPEPEAPKGPTKEDIGLKLKALIEANKRTEAVALLKKFNAASASGLAVENYAAFIEDADGILMVG